MGWGARKRGTDILVELFQHMAVFVGRLQDDGRSVDEVLGELMSLASETLLAVLRETVTGKI